MAKAKKDKADREQGLYRREEGLSKLSAAERKAMEAYAADYMGFLGEAKTERLAYRASVALLEKNGFRPISGFKTLKPGDKVYRGYHGKTLLAAVIGSSPLGEGLNAKLTAKFVPEKNEFKARLAYPADKDVYAEMDKRSAESSGWHPDPRKDAMAECTLEFVTGADQEKLMCDYLKRRLR